MKYIDIKKDNSLLVDQKSNANCKSLTMTMKVHTIYLSKGSTAESIQKIKTNNFISQKF